MPTSNPDDAVTIRDFLVQKLTPNAAKRCLTQLSACCDWAVKSRLVTENRFIGMAAAIKTPKAQASKHDINPFTASERDLIIEAFESDRYYGYYATLVRFLFITGCRPSEAIALQWKHISKDFRLITFEQAVTISTSGLALKSGLKSQEKRIFPCNTPMQNFLSSVKKDSAKPDDLLFPSPEGKYIDFHNFRNRAWKTILTRVDIPYRKPYQTRHTFITLALDNGLDAKDVGRLVGNSPEIIYRYYAANRRYLFVPEF